MRRRDTTELTETWNGAGHRRRAGAGRDGPAELLADGANPARPEAGQHDYELLAAVAGRHVGLAQVRAQDLGDVAQHVVAHGWPNVSLTRLKLSTSIISSPTA